jgi:hypothetical protein
VEVFAEKEVKAKMSPEEAKKYEEFRLEYEELQQHLLFQDMRQMLGIVAEQSTIKE